MTDTLRTYDKQPDEVLDYPISFADWLTSKGESLSAGHTAVISVDASGELSIDSHTVILGVVTIWLSGGVDGSDYKVTATMTTEAGRVKEGEITMRVREI